MFIHTRGELRFNLNSAHTNHLEINYLWFIFRIVCLEKGSQCHCCYNFVCVEFFQLHLVVFLFSSCKRFDFRTTNEVILYMLHKKLGFIMWSKSFLLCIAWTCWLLYYQLHEYTASSRIVITKVGLLLPVFPHNKFIFVNRSFGQNCLKILVLFTFVSVNPYPILCFSWSLKL